MEWYNQFKLQEHANIKVRFPQGHNTFKYCKSNGNGTFSPCGGGGMSQIHFYHLLNTVILPLMCYTCIFCKPEHFFFPSQDRRLHIRSVDWRYCSVQRLEMNNWERHELSRISLCSKVSTEPHGLLVKNTSRGRRETSSKSFLHLLAALSYTLFKKSPQLTSRVSTFLSLYIIEF